MGSLARRIADLEKLYSAGSWNLAQGPPEGWMETMAASLKSRTAGEDRMEWER